MKIKRISIACLFAIAILLWHPHVGSAQNGVELKTPPNEFARKMIHKPAFVENAKGENFCWHARVDMDDFVGNYQLTGNSAWLDAGVSYFDFLIAKLDTDPDGYQGWIGPYAYDGKYWQDALVGDAILFSGILDFCVIVLENDQLKKIYGSKANSYVAIAEKSFVEKWDKRGTWIDDGPYGAYIGFNKFLDPAHPKEWLTDSKVSRAGISHPFNKQLDAADVCLRLFRITGNKFYRDRAEKIFFTIKSHFQYFDDHYCWNYFDPLTPGDVDLEMNDTRHGVWVHPWRSGYQAGDVDKIVEAYHYGIVFDAEDIKRIINTNLNVMWNKDKVHPEFINSNGLGADHDTTGIAAFQGAYGHSTVYKNAGELWTALADFDQTIRNLYELQLKDPSRAIERMRYEKTVLKNPPGFKRKYIKKVAIIPDINFSESKELNLAAVLPHTIAKGGKSIIICQSWNPGELQIDLYSTTNKLVRNLFNGKMDKGIFLITWDGSDPEKREVLKGDYKIRWTIGEGYREFPVVVK